MTHIDYVLADRREFELMALLDDVVGGVLWQLVAAIENVTGIVYVKSFTKRLLVLWRERH